RDIESRWSRADMQGLLGAVPDVLETAHKRVVNRAPQGLPSQRGVDSVELIDQRLSDRRVAARIRDAQVDIRGFADVPVGAQVPDRTQIAAFVGVEYITGIAAENLRGSLEEEVFGRGQNAAERQPGVVNSILATHQVLRHQGPV